MEEKIKKLWEEYKEECEEIADLCEEEGFPRYGENYDLRCGNAYSWYQEQEDTIRAEHKRRARNVEKGRRFSEIRFRKRAGF